MAKISGNGLGGAAVLLVAVVAFPLAALLLVAVALGYTLGFVRTESMAPAHPPGALVVAAPIDATDVEAGQVLMFEDPARPGRTVTHRVIEVRRTPQGELRFVTKGDNNPEADVEAVPAENVRAVVRWSIPRLGTWFDRLTGPWTPVVLIGVPALIVLVGELRDRRRGAEPAPATIGGTVTDPVECADCATVIVAEDRYCRRCGTRQPVRRPTVVEVEQVGAGVVAPVR